MKIIGHRGEVAGRPENTMAAFREAARLGADGIEFDVQQCRDGTLVVIHDFTLDRTTNGIGLVANSASRDVAALDAGSWLSPDFGGERVPRLADVLALPDCDFELELKGYGRRFLEPTLSCVEAAGVLGAVGAIAVFGPPISRP